MNNSKSGDDNMHVEAYAIESDFLPLQCKNVKDIDKHCWKLYIYLNSESINLFKEIEKYLEVRRSTGLSTLSSSATWTYQLHK